MRRRTEAGEAQEISKLKSTPQREAVGQVFRGTFGRDLWMKFEHKRVFATFGLSPVQKALIVDIINSPELTEDMNNMAFINKLEELLGY